MSHDDKWKAHFPFPGPRKFWKLADIVNDPVIYLWNPLNLLELEKCLLDKTNTNKKQYDKKTCVMFYAGRHKGAEHTAGLRAIQGYFSAWTDTMHMKCWHFGNINLYATKKRTPHLAKRFLDAIDIFLMMGKTQHKTFVPKSSFVMTK